MIRAGLTAAVALLVFAAPTAADPGVPAPNPNPALGDVCAAPQLRVVAGKGDWAPGLPSGQVEVNARPDFGPLTAGITFKTTGTLDWHNLSTGNQGHADAGGVNAATFKVDTGPGDVEFTSKVDVPDGPGPFGVNDNWHGECTGNYTVA